MLSVGSSFRVRSILKPHAVTVTVACVNPNGNVDLIYDHSQTDDPQGPGEVEIAASEIAPHAIPLLDFELVPFESAAVEAGQLCVRDPAECALRCKEFGNQLLGLSDYSAAQKWYSLGIDLLKQVPTCPGCMPCPGIVTSEGKIRIVRVMGRDGDDAAMVVPLGDLIDDPSHAHGSLPVKMPAVTMRTSRLLCCPCQAAAVPQTLLYVNRGRCRLNLAGEDSDLVKGALGDFSTAVALYKMIFQLDWVSADQMVDGYVKSLYWRVKCKLRLGHYHGALADVGRIRQVSASAVADELEREVRDERAKSARADRQLVRSLMAHVDFATTGTVQMEVDDNDLPGQ